ncbi:MAG: sigma-70 family RNA polymerase sigma factor [Bryobacteraceae bacterium]|nr:sigma-70 family RNA polymerase sigma factor [Bryobacteraceae bacterium]
MPAPAREALLGPLRERILAFAASRMERSAAEDLAQETMLVLHEKYAHLDAPEDLLPVAFQVLRFKMAAHVRKRKRRGEDHSLPVDEIPLPAAEPDPEQAALAAERRACLLEGFASLGERCRELLRLKIAGHGFEAIRKHFGAASINTIYTWDLRCRNQLRESLRQIWGGRR